MNPEIKADWLVALRSGDYRQGRGFLKSGEESLSYCCLGVLCELAVKAGIIEESTVGDETAAHSFESNTPSTGLSHSSSYLPGAVAEWAGIHYQGKIHYEDGSERVRVDLADLNDYKLDFHGIANVIEKEF